MNTTDDLIPHVDILRVRLPLLTREQAIDLLLDRLDRRETTGVCFPDMTMMNLASRDDRLRGLLQGRMLVLNDGAGMSWIARRLGRPFPDDLNGTDLFPQFLDKTPPGTRIYLVGGETPTPEKARETLAKKYPHLEFVGRHHGYFDEEGERTLVREIREASPGLVLVGMGKAQQVHFIDSRLDDPALAGVVWIAVGGLLDRYAGSFKRAPAWMRRMNLEWLHIITQHPHKARRYLLGIPAFLARCIAAQARNGHGCR